MRARGGLSTALFSSPTSRRASYASKFRNLSIYQAVTPCASYQSFSPALLPLASSRRPGGYAILPATTSGESQQRRRLLRAREGGVPIFPAQGKMPMRPKCKIRQKRQIQLLRTRAIPPGLQARKRCHRDPSNMQKSAGSADRRCSTSEKRQKRQVLHHSDVDPAQAAGSSAGGFFAAARPPGAVSTAGNRYSGKNGEIGNVDHGFTRRRPASTVALARVSG